MQKYKIADYPEGATMIPWRPEDDADGAYYAASDVDACIAEHQSAEGLLEMVIEQKDKRIAELVDRIQILRGALADIAFSDDMTLEVARAKAKRIYESSAS